MRKSEAELRVKTSCYLWLLVLWDFVEDITALFPCQHIQVMWLSDNRPCDNSLTSVSNYPHPVVLLLLHLHDHHHNHHHHHHHQLFYSFAHHSSSLHQTIQPNYQTATTNLPFSPSSNPPSIHPSPNHPSIQQSSIIHPFRLCHVGSCPSFISSSFYQ